MYSIDDLSPGQEAENTERFESDTEKLVHRHLRDKNHVITEEEIKSLRVGVTTAGAEADAAVARQKEDNVTNPSHNGPVTKPWDVTEPPVI